MFDDSCLVILVACHGNTKAQYATFLLLAVVACNASSICYGVCVLHMDMMMLCNVVQGISLGLIRFCANSVPLLGIFYNFARMCKHIPT